MEARKSEATFLSMLYSRLMRVVVICAADEWVQDRLSVS